MVEPIIQDYPPADGKQYDCQCARCGSSCEHIDCFDCEDGFSDHDCGEDTCPCAEPELNVVCDTCRGYGGWWNCISTPEFCNGTPIPGRESVKRGKVEWFEVNLG